MDDSLDDEPTAGDGRPAWGIEIRRQPMGGLFVHCETCEAAIAIDCSEQTAQFALYDHLREHIAGWKKNRSRTPLTPALWQRILRVLNHSLGRA